MPDTNATESRTKILCDDHDWFLGHVRIEQLSDSRIICFIGKRDLEIREGQIIGSGMGACAPIHDCKDCVPHICDPKGFGEVTTDA